MKKRIIALLSMLAMVVISVTTFAGCKKENYNFSLTDISGNGNIGVVKGNYYYYINGATTDTAKKGDDIEISAIYKQELDADKNVVGEPSRLYSCIAGFKNGQLQIFDDYLYFATPSTEKSNSATTLSSRTSFCRIKLDGTNFKRLYTTEGDSTLSYAYYHVSDTELYLVTYESNKLISIKIDKKCKPQVLDEEVTSVVFSENNGKGSDADEHIFYTKVPDKNYVAQTGNVVYSCLASGDSKIINSGEDISLLEIKHGYLYFKLGDIIYRTTTISGISKQNVVSYKSFDEFILTSDGGIVVKDADASGTYYYNWSSGSLVSRKLLSSSDYSFMLEDSGHIYLLNSSKYIYRISLSEVNQTAEQVQTSDVVYTAGEYLTYEVVGSRLNYFSKTISTDATGSEVTTYTFKSVAI